MDDRRFNDVFNECLNRVLRGEPIEQCLADHPEQSADLRPLLETACGISRAVVVQPRPEFKARARAEFDQALRAAVEDKQRRGFKLAPRWGMALAGILVVLLAGGGTVMAAGGSMPDQPLYPVKLATEQVRVAFTFSKVGKAEVYADLADKRVDEMVVMAEQGNSRQLEETNGRLNHSLALVIELAGVAAPANAEMKMMAPAPEGRAPAGANGEEPPAYEEAPGEPATEEAPAPMQAPAPFSITAGDSRSDDGSEAGSGQDNGQLAKLKAVVVLQAADNSRTLHDALRNASPQARAALQRAIAESEMSYQEVISALSAE